jgi:hypothetical protein
MPDVTLDTDDVDPSEDDATADDATDVDATNDDSAVETSTDEAEENNEVAPVGVHVEADSTKMPGGVPATTPADKPLGN